MRTAYNILLLSFLYLAGLVELRLADLYEHQTLQTQAEAEGWTETREPGQAVQVQSGVYLSRGHSLEHKQ